MEYAIILKLSEEELREFPEEIEFRDQSTQTEEDLCKDYKADKQTQSDETGNIPSLLDMHVFPLGHRTPKQDSPGNRHRKTDRIRYRYRNYVGRLRKKASVTKQKKLSREQLSRV